MHSQPTGKPFCASPKTFLPWQHRLVGIHNSLPEQYTSLVEIHNGYPAQQEPVCATHKPFPAGGHGLNKVNTPPAVQQKAVVAAQTGGGLPLKMQILHVFCSWYIDLNPSPGTFRYIIPIRETLHNPHFSAIGIWVNTRWAVCPIVAISYVVTIGIDGLYFNQR